MSPTIWREAGLHGLSSKLLAEAERIIEEHQDAFKDAWRAWFSP